MRCSQPRVDAGGTGNNPQTRHTGVTEESSVPEREYTPRRRHYGDAAYPMERDNNRVVTGGRHSPIAPRGDGIPGCPKGWRTLQSWWWGGRSLAAGPGGRGNALWERQWLFRGRRPGACVSQNPLPAPSARTPPRIPHQTADAAFPAHIPYAVPKIAFSGRDIPVARLHDQTNSLSPPKYACHYFNPLFVEGNSQFTEFTGNVVYSSLWLADSRIINDESSSGGSISTGLTKPVIIPSITPYDVGAEFPGRVRCRIVVRGRRCGRMWVFLQKK